MSELKKYEIIKATIEDLNAIDFNNVIYGERSNPGAMGMSGHVWLYVLQDGTMKRYDTNIRDEDGGAAWHCGQDLISENFDLFDVYAGGMGNGVLVRKNTKITAVDNSNEDYYLLYDGYEIDPSVRGVFNNIAHALTKGGVGTDNGDTELQKAIGDFGSKLGSR